MSDRIAIGAPKDGIALKQIEPGEDEIGALAEAFASIDPWLSYDYRAAALTGYFAMQEPGAPRYKIMAGEATAGIVGVRLRWLRGPYLQFLGVLPAFQSRGIGTAVLDWFERLGREQGERNIWVAVSSTNAGAIAFYERHGFTDAATLDDLVGDGLAELLMRKRIAPDRDRSGPYQSGA